ncbi:hypothetical protein Hanom_Chr06g00566421 [Helianthus anomalus]
MVQEKYTSRILNGYDIINLQPTHNKLIILKKKNKKNVNDKKKSKLQKSSFLYVTYCKLCLLSSIITENVLDVCKPLQVMSFSPNSINFCV